MQPWGWHLIEMFLPFLEYFFLLLLLSLSLFLLLLLFEKHAIGIPMNTEKMVYLIFFLLHFPFFLKFYEICRQFKMKSIIFNSIQSKYLSVTIWYNFQR